MSAQPTTTLTRYDDSEIRNDLTLSQVGQIFAKSGYFSDTKSEAQAISKILAGRENGFGAFTSMSGIHIIQGKLEMGADLIATAIKRSGKYNYQITQFDNMICTIEFFECSLFTGGRWQKIGVSTFSQEDAKQAGLVKDGGMYKKFPRNMLFARAMTNGQAWYCPDVFQSRIYANGEISGALPPDEEEGESPISQPVNTPSRETEDIAVCDDIIQHLQTLAEQGGLKNGDVEKFKKLAGLYQAEKAQDWTSGLTPGEWRTRWNAWTSAYPRTEQEETP